MGYDLHITRAESWAENDGMQIGADEWLAVVREDPELTLVPENGPYFARWRGPSRHPEAWLDWFAGNVFTKSPDSALLRKMIAVAERLGARVQGDEGEFYAGDELLDDFSASVAAESRAPSSRLVSWWRRLTGR